MAALNVLLVEDNELNRDMLARRLARHGMTTTCALDGADGVAQAQASRPDVILMDISLPVIDGWEAIRRIRASPETSAIPIIALTAHVLLEDRTRAASAGCSAFVSKPIDMSALVEKIHLACAKDTVE